MILTSQQPFCPHPDKPVEQYADSHDDNRECQRQENRPVMSDIFDPNHDRDELKADDTDGTLGDGADRATERRDACRNAQNR